MAGVPIPEETGASLMAPALEGSQRVTPPLYDGAMGLRYDETKFTELLLYVAGRLADDRAGGATKLNKVIFFTEFTHVRPRRRHLGL